MNMDDKFFIYIKNKDGCIFTQDIYFDADIHDWLQVFRNILYWVSFHPDTIREYLGESE